jgi:hypothetical protein
MIQPVLLSGVFIGVLSALPIINLANCCCLWVMGGGVLAVYLTQQQTHETVSAPHGALLGLLAGVAGACVWLVAYAIVDVVVGPLQQRMVAAMLQGPMDIPPDVRQMLETMTSQSSGWVRFIAGFFFQLGAGVIFATVGGLIGAVYLRREVPSGTRRDPREHPPMPE